jgi:hypothetical protein
LRRARPAEERTARPQQGQGAGRSALVSHPLPPRLRYVRGRSARAGAAPCRQGLALFFVTCVYESPGFVRTLIVALTKSAQAALRFLVLARQNNLMAHDNKTS